MHKKAFEYIMAREKEATENESSEKQPEETKTNQLPYIFLPQLGYRIEVALLIISSVFLSMGIQQLFGSGFVSLKRTEMPTRNSEDGDGLQGEIQEFDVTPNPIYTYNYDLNGGEHSLHDCHGQLFKQSFHNIDYALFGYNILRGYPLAIGHDPGFKHPIFLADYSQNLSTADCRYSVPYGLTAVSDISCVTSFSSSIVQSTYEFAKSLSASAEASGGGWGVHFSASAGYKESTSTIVSGETLFVMSEAKCNYYFTKIEQSGPPPFHPNFLTKIKELESDDQNMKQLYIDFFDSYGTHFPTKMLFGARFTFQNKMSMSSYKTAKESSYSISAQASYSGLISIGGGFNLDSSQRDAASSFSKSVETTIIAVGAPPSANGDTMTWASTIKDSPVPSQYALESIEELFTAPFMNNTGIDYNKIRTNIIKYKEEYCRDLKNRGEIWSCSEMQPGLNITGHVLMPSSGLRLWQDLPMNECIQLCERIEKCYLVWYSPHNCSTLLFSSLSLNEQIVDSTFFIASDITNIVFRSKLIMAQVDLQVFGALVAQEIIPHSTVLSSCSPPYCRDQCLDDPYCFIISISQHFDRFCKCHLYTEESLMGYDAPFVMNSYGIIRFISRGEHQGNSQEQNTNLE